MPRLTTQIEVKVGEDDYAYPTVAIDYDYSPGCGAHTYPGEYAPTDPPEPAEVGFVSAQMMDAAGTELTPGHVQEIALTFLNSKEGYREAVDNAEYYRRGDPDTAYDAWRDERKGEIWIPQIDDF